MKLPVEDRQARAVLESLVSELGGSVIWKAGSVVICEYSGGGLIHRMNNTALLASREAQELREADRRQTSQDIQALRRQVGELSRLLGYEWRGSTKGSWQPRQPEEQP